MTNREDHEKKEVLLMFSSGRDSFLSACRLIADGYTVHMITFVNGHMSGIDAADEEAKRIITKYGESRAVFVGKYSIVDNIYPLLKKYLYTSARETGENFLDIPPIQMPCLACHTAMYLMAIAYCKVHNIRYIAEGAREAQGFFVELPEMAQRYEKLVQSNQMELILPVYDLVSDWDRKLELAGKGFIPKTKELQCWLGCPMEGPLSEAERKSLAAYYDNFIVNLLQPRIDALVKDLSFPDGSVRVDHYEI